MTHTNQLSRLIDKPLQFRKEEKTTSNQNTTKKSSAEKLGEKAYAKVEPNEHVGYKENDHEEGKQIGNIPLEWLLTN
jgi:hypothetical protein